MMPAHHVLASAATSAFFFSLTKSWGGSVACFLSGVLIDLDHWLDCCIIQKKLCLSFQEVKRFCFKNSGKIYLVLHSYELMAGLWALVVYLEASALWLGLLYGMTVHLLIDQLTNTVHPLAYFLFYRIKEGFPKSIFFQDTLAKKVNDYGHAIS